MTPLPVTQPETRLARTSRNEIWALCRWNMLAERRV